MTAGQVGYFGWAKIGKMNELKKKCLELCDQGMNGIFVHDREVTTQCRHSPSPVDSVLFDDEHPPEMFP